LWKTLKPEDIGRLYREKDRYVKVKDLHLSRISGAVGGKKNRKEEGGKGLSESGEGRRRGGIYYNGPI